MGNTVYIQREKCDHVRTKNDTGADLVQYQFAIVGPYAAVADEAIANGAVGSFHVEEGIQVHTTALHASEHTFGTVGNPVYWDPVTETFSDTAEDGYYLVGYVILTKDSDGVVVFEKARYATILPNTLVAAQAAVDEITEHAGIPFMATATLESNAADVAVELLEDAAVPTGKKVYIHQIIATVDGATEWGTVTKVTVQDSSAVGGAEFAVADLEANAVLTLGDATLLAPIAKHAGFTAKKGIEVVADKAGTGSDLIVTVYGYIA